MKYFILIIIALFVNECKSQIMRNGILKGKLLSDSSKEFLVIDYRNDRYLSYEIYNMISNKLIYHGFLNRTKFNNNNIHKNVVVYEKREYYGFERMQILTDGFIYYEPTIEFKDTADLVSYDFMHLLEDSVGVRYLKMTTDTVRTKIYQCSNGEFYSLTIGKYRLYNEEKLYSENYVKELGHDIFFLQERKLQGEVGTFKIWGPLIGIVSEFNFKLDKTNVIKSGMLSISDSVFRYENNKLLEFNDNEH